MAYPRMPNEVDTNCPCYGTGVLIDLIDPNLIKRCDCGRYAYGSWLEHHTHHPQILLATVGHVAVVDELLAPLIAQAWEYGIWTTTSCQGGMLPNGDFLRGQVNFTDPQRGRELLRVWGWDEPGLAYFELRPGGQGAAVIFESEQATTATKFGLEHGLFGE